MKNLNVPKRASSPRRESDNSALWWVAAIGVCVVGAIAYQHLGPGADDRIQAQEAAEAQAQDRAASLGAARPMKEQPLEMAKPIPTERIGRTVNHVQDSDACSRLRSERERVQRDMKRSPSAAQTREYELDLKSIRNRGTELGCWSGGAG